MKTTQEYERQIAKLEREIVELKSQLLNKEVDEENAKNSKDVNIEDVLTEELVAEFLKEKFNARVEPESGNLRAKALMTVDWNAWWLTLAAELIKFVVEKFLEKKEKDKEGDSNE